MIRVPGGELVKSSVHYSIVDGGAMTAPDNAIFNPFTKKWVAENKSIAPDTEQKITAAIAQGRDLQLERGVVEAFKLLEKEPWLNVEKSFYSERGKKQ